MAPLSLIAAMSTNRVIGNKGQLPWHEPEDMEHFKRTTLGHAVIMGRATYDALGRPLPRRRNIVVTRHVMRLPCEVTHTLEEAVAMARTTDPEPFIIGGGQIYTQALPLVTRMYLTIVQKEAEGDAFFPEFAEAQWREVERRTSGILLFRTLDRIG
jgi:dihydrofolate reductase